MTKQIDTLQISEDLIEAGVDSKAAKELAHQFKLAREDIITKKEAKEYLATKSDIESTKAEIADTKAEITAEIADTKLEIEKLRAETIERVEKLRADTAKSFQNQTIWLSGIMLTGFITLASLIISNI